MQRAKENLLLAMMVAAISMVAAGCESGVGGPTPNDPAPSNPAPGHPDNVPPAKGDEIVKDPSGVWKHETGPFANYGYQGMEWVGQYLVLEKDGSFRMVMAETTTGALECYDGIYIAIHDAIFLSFDYGYAEEFFAEESSFLVFGLPDDNTLTLKGASEQPTTFRREAALPAAFNCGALEMVALFDNIPAYPDDDGGLAFDGVKLWFTDENDDKVYPIDPDTAALGTPITLDGARIVHASTGADFWGFHDSRVAERRNPANVQIDAVSTKTDLGVEDFYIEALAFNATNQTLWLHGYDEALGASRFLAVNAAAEPDVLLGNSPFPVTLTGVAWDGEYLWGLGRNEVQSVMLIHPRTFKVLATYKVPPDGVYYNGIAAVGDSLFLIAGDYRDYTAVLSEFKPAE